MDSEQSTEGNSQTDEGEINNIFSAQNKFFNTNCIFWIICFIVGCIVLSTLLSNGSSDSSSEEVEEDGSSTFKSSSGKVSQSYSPPQSSPNT